MVDDVACVSSVVVCCTSGFASSSLNPKHMFVAQYKVFWFPLLAVQISSLTVYGLSARSLKHSGKYSGVGTCKLMEMSVFFV